MYIIKIGSQFFFFFFRHIGGCIHFICEVPSVTLLRMAVSQLFTTFIASVANSNGLALVSRGGVVTYQW